MHPGTRQALFATDASPPLVRAMAPTGTRRAQVNALVRALKNAGAWTSIDHLYVRAAADSAASRLNWVNPTKSLTPIASPALTADRFMLCNGTTQYEYSQSGYRAAYLGGQNLPDGPGGDTGKGFTCTGLERDPTDGTWWVGDDGRHTEASPGVQQTALLRLSSDFTTILTTVDLKTLYPTIGTVQGVAYDTSDDTLWIASTDENLIRHITKAGADLGTFAAAAVNGLAYDSLNDALIWIASTGAATTATWIRCSDGTTLKTKKVRGLCDQFYFDPADGTEGSLYTSSGVNGNGSYGWVDKIDVASNLWQGSWFLPEALAIEGIYVRNGVLYVMNDGYYHLGTLNQVLTYSVDALGVGMSTRIVVAGTTRMVASPAATVCLASGNDPLSAWGVGLFVPTGGTTLRLIVITTAGTQITVNWTVTVTTRFSYWVDMDLTAKTAALYVNGALVSSQALTGVGASLPKMVWAFGATFELPPARFANCEHSLFMVGRDTPLANVRSAFEQAASNYYAGVGLTVP